MGPLLISETLQHLRFPVKLRIFLSIPEIPGDLPETIAV